MCSLLQMVAGITTEGGHQFLPGQVLPISRQKGLDAGGKSRISGFLIKEDELGTVNSPFGAVQLILLVGVTTDEMEQVKDRKLNWGQLNERIPDGVTDYKR